MEKFNYYFWIFMFGSFLGVVVEMIWCVFKNKKVESRKGLIFGPFNPLYGCAVTFITMAINCCDKKSIGRIFLIGVFVASLVEYACSYYQEKIIGTVSWDYKNFKYNLNGRINLVYSLFWGMLTLVWYGLFMPYLEKFIVFISPYSKVMWICLIFMIINCAISLGACLRWKNRRGNVKAKTILDKHFDIVYNDEVLEKIYPNAEFRD